MDSWKHVEPICSFSEVLAAINHSLLSQTSRKRSERLLPPVFISCRRQCVVVFKCAFFNVSQTGWLCTDLVCGLGKNSCPPLSLFNIGRISRN